jgi:predicted glycosyltransferase
MKILFYFGHPAQFLFAKNSIKNLADEGHNIKILIKRKDVLEQLIENTNFKYHNILPEGRKDSESGIVLGLLKREWRIFNYTRKAGFNLFIGTDPALIHVGKLLNIPVITPLEDDAYLIPKLTKITYPFTTHIFAPVVCKVGKDYKPKKLSYNGYMKLAYLHPNYFKADRSKIMTLSKPYILIRFAKLTAHHDVNVEGMRLEFIDKLLKIAGAEYNIYINSEYPLPDRYERFRLEIQPSDIHHVLNYSKLFISDSQSMTVEAAMLGTPSIRYSSFAGRISVLNELETKYSLTQSIKPPAEEELIRAVEEIINKKNLKEIYQDRRKKMLTDKIDVTELFTDLINRYPQSLERFK